MPPIEMINLKKCKLSQKQFQDAVKYGVNVEMEHTKSKRKALLIAKQHECEFPGRLYYKEGLLPMERRLKRRK